MTDDELRVRIIAWEGALDAVDEKLRHLMRQNHERIERGNFSEKEEKRLVRSSKEISRIMREMKSLRNPKAAVDDAKRNVPTS